jgi:hypothetical protein
MTIIVFFRDGHFEAFDYESDVHVSDWEIRIGDKTFTPRQIAKIEMVPA